MYRVLRVPPNKDSYYKAYETLKMMLYNCRNMIQFDDFYNYIDSIYMLADDIGYIGAAYLGHKTVREVRLPYRFKDDDVYSMNIVTVSNDNLYVKLYDLIHTIIRDKNDRIIVAEKVPDIKELKNALSNNKFKLLNDTQMYYHLPETYIFNEPDQLKKIDPTDDKEIIDDYVFYCHNYNPNKNRRKYSEEVLENITKDYMEIKRNTFDPYEQF